MLKRTLLSLLLVVCALPLFAGRNDAKFRRGGGMMVFTGYEPMQDHPVNLYYYIPTNGNIRKMRVLISMHGAERSGLIQRGVWRNLAEEYGFIVLAPEFTHANGYPENGYQFGYVSETPKTFTLRPREKWTYQLIEAVFEYFRQMTGNESETYDMFGHSAGAQFVHRYLLAMPEARVGRAVVANPSTYTYPYEDGMFPQPEGEAAGPFGWPYSIMETPFVDEEYLEAFFRRDMVIMIGSEDNDPQNASLAKGPEAMAQGRHRYERAWRFFRIAQQIAQKRGMEFNWSIREVPGAGHSSAQMVYGQGVVRNWRIEDNERVYNLRDVTNYGAYRHIFER